MFALPLLPNQKSNVGFYFHVPFCPHICPYCDFIKTSRFNKKDVDAYFASMENQLNQFLQQYSNNPYILQSSHCTVYFGGGTPSLFPAKYYKPFLDILSKNFSLEEVSIETNPFTNKQNFILDYKNIGFNRVTLGAQSLCQETLKTLGRKHTKQDILNNIQWLKEAGFEQIQVDLIYGLNQKRSLAITDEVKILLDAGATGISAYGLTIESRTVFGQSKKQIVDDEIAISEYNELLEICNKLGLHQIETSNFSFYPAKHNQIYWSGYPYFGIGTGAHGLLPPTQENPYGTRYKVGEPLEEFEAGNDNLKFGNSTDYNQNFKLIYEPTRTKSQMLEELIFTLLRTQNGISLDWFCEITHQNKENLVKSLYFSSKLSTAFNEKQILIENDFLLLSQKEKIRGDMWASILINALKEQKKTFMIKL